MARNITRGEVRESPWAGGAARWLLVVLCACLVAGSAQVAQAGCVNCVKYDSSNTNKTGAGGATTLSVSLTVPPATTCPDAMLLAVISVIGAAGPPKLKAPALASAAWGATTMTYEAGTDTFSSLANDQENLHVEMWTLPSPATGSGTLTFTLAGGASAQMVGGGVVMCSVAGVAARNATNNTSTEVEVLQTLTDASGRMYIDNCALDGDITAGLYRTPQQQENWNAATGTIPHSSSNVLGTSSRVAMIHAGLTYGYTFSASTYYACDAITFNPKGTTSVGLESFTAKAFRTGTVLTWKTGQEAGNLGYRLFREDDGQRVQVTPEIIAGSALSYPGSPLQAGYSYGWWDPEGRASSRYYLEDLEIGGPATLRGPFAPEGRTFEEHPVGLRNATPLSQVGGSQSLMTVKAAGVVALTPVFDRPVSPIRERDRRTQLLLAAGEGAKVVIRQEGWYRLTGAELAAAGVNYLGSNPETLRLFVNGSEQAIRVNAGGDGSFDAADSVEFYGVPLDTQSAGTQTYWLVQGTERGERIAVQGGAATAGKLFTSTYTAESRERLFYAGGVLNGATENFFGRVVTTKAAAMGLQIAGVDTGSQQSAKLEVAVEGFSNVPHEVQVSLNGEVVGRIAFAGKGRETLSVPVPVGLLVEGQNQIALLEVGNATAVSAAVYGRVSYPRVANARNDLLAFSLTPAEISGPARVSGFSEPAVRVFDVTNPGQVTELQGAVSKSAMNGYLVDFVPQFGGESVRHFVAIADRAALKTASISANRPSAWWKPENKADYVAIAYGSLIPALADLKALRESQGLKVAVVDVEDVYDEFGFGVKSPEAIQAFIRAAVSGWQVPPRFVLLVGDGSQDPRDYLGLGQDLIPTKLVDTKTVETASDDWMADVNGDGKPGVAIGRLPAKTPADVAAMVAKIVTHERAARGLDKALFVADTAVLTNFEEQNQGILGLVPPSVSVETANADSLGDAGTRGAILNSVRSGVDLVHYSGHGTIDHWRGNLLSVDDVPLLTNAERLPIVTVSNCLTGIFQEPLMEGLGKVLVKAPTAGAVAVWGSSGTTEVPGQVTMMTEFMRSAFVDESVKTLGEAIVRAKAAVADPDVRNTWILLGDPATRIH